MSVPIEEIKFFRQSLDFCADCYDVLCFWAPVRASFVCIFVRFGRFSDALRPWEMKGAVGAAHCVV